MARDRP